MIKLNNNCSQLDRLPEYLDLMSPTLVSVAPRIGLSDLIKALLAALTPLSAAGADGAVETRPQDTSISKDAAAPAMPAARGLDGGVSRRRLNSNAVSPPTLLPIDDDEAVTAAAAAPEEAPATGAPGTAKSFILTVRPVLLSTMSWVPSRRTLREYSWARCITLLRSAGRSTVSFSSVRDGS